MVYQLIYTSSATSLLDDRALHEIAQSSREKNRALGITGLLLCHEGILLHILEGDENDVSSLYDKIAKDSHHTGCMVLNHRQAEKREFSDWFVGYKNVSKDSHGETLFHLNKRTLASVMPCSPSPELKALTQTYAKVSGLNA